MIGTKTIRRSIVYIDPETKIVIRPLKILHGYKYFIIGVPNRIFQVLKKKGGIGSLIGSAGETFQAGSQVGSSSYQGTSGKYSAGFGSQSFSMGDDGKVMMDFGEEQPTYKGLGPEVFDFGMSGSQMKSGSFGQGSSSFSTSPQRFEFDQMDDMKNDGMEDDGAYDSKGPKQLLQQLKINDEDEYLQEWENQLRNSGQDPISTFYNDQT